MSKIFKRRIEKFKDNVEVLILKKGIEKYPNGLGKIGVKE